MAQCSDCYNGCVNIVTDKCVKYTGVDVAVLGIQTGDSLSFVEQALITFLTSVLDGTGIKLDIDEEIICDLVGEYLDDCGDLTAVDLFKALIQAACNLQEQVTTLDGRVDVIEADYTVNCLEEVEAGDGTHAILQAVITKLCETDTALAALALDLDTNYVKLADLNSLIQAYLDEQEITDKAYAKMIPYVAYPYHGATSNYPATGDSFDVNGVGSNYWEDVYLCNGYSGLTPDYRGRVGVGAIVGMVGGPLDVEVDPAVNPTFNPNYAVNDKTGENYITLTEDQMPEHTHTNTVNEEDHTHLLVKLETSDAVLTADNYIARERNQTSDLDYRLRSSVVEPDIALSGPAKTNLTVTIDNTGGDDAHNNKQPAIASYFIMYVPS